MISRHHNRTILSSTNIHSRLGCTPRPRNYHSNDKMDHSLKDQPCLLVRNEADLSRTIPCLSTIFYHIR